MGYSAALSFTYLVIMIVSLTIIAKVLVVMIKQTDHAKSIHIPKIRLHLHLVDICGGAFPSGHCQRHLRIFSR